MKTKLFNYSKKHPPMVGDHVAMVASNDEKLTYEVKKVFFYGSTLEIVVLPGKDVELFVGPNQVKLINRKAK